MLTTNELADRLGVHPVTVRQWRVEGTGPRFITVGRSAIRYRESDVEAYLAARARTSTAPVSPEAAPRFYCGCGEPLNENDVAFGTCGACGAPVSPEAAPPRATTPEPTPTVCRYTGERAERGRCPIHHGDACLLFLPALIAEYDRLRASLASSGETYPRLTDLSSASGAGTDIVVLREMVANVIASTIAAMAGDDEDTRIARACRMALDAELARLTARAAEAERERDCGSDTRDMLMDAVALGIAASHLADVAQHRLGCAYPALGDPCSCGVQHAVTAVRAALAPARGETPTPEHGDA